MLQRWSVYWREHGHVTVGGHFHGGRMSHVTEVASLREGEWSCYRDGHQFKGRENGHVHRDCQFNRGRKVIRGSEVVSLME